MQPIIQIENIEYTYPGEDHPALRGISLAIEPGTFTAVLGHNALLFSSYCNLGKA